VSPEAAIYLRSVAGVSRTCSLAEHSAHMKRFETFAQAAAALRQVFPEDEVEEQIQKLAAKLGATP